MISIVVSHLPGRGARIERIIPWRDMPRSQDRIRALADKAGELHRQPQPPRVVIAAVPDVPAFFRAFPELGPQ